jgi:hypothetical protein
VLISNEVGSLSRRFSVGSISGVPVWACSICLFGRDGEMDAPAGNRSGADGIAADIGIFGHQNLGDGRFGRELTFDQPGRSLGLPPRFGSALQRGSMRSGPTAAADVSTTAATNCSSSAFVDRSWRACRRQVNTCWGVSPCRRAISETIASGTSVCLTIRALPSLKNQRRRSVSGPFKEIAKSNPSLTLRDGGRGRTPTDGCVTIRKRPARLGLAQARSPEPVCRFH